MFPPLTERVLDAMRPALAAFDLNRLEAETYTIYALTEQMHLGYLNPAWFEFARENNGAAIETHFGLGTPVLTGISPPLQDHYEALLHRSRRLGQAVESRYLCPSSTLERVFLLRILPLTSGGWLVHNALVVQQAHGDEARPFTSEYRDRRGLIVQCSSCRRVRYGSDVNRWDWVPALLDNRFDPVSHGLCEPCLGFVFPPEPSDSANVAASR